MKWVEPRNANSNFGAPTGWDPKVDGPCGVLPLRREVEGRHFAHYSNWRPDERELAMLNSGGVVELCCVGLQPPVSVGVVESADAVPDAEPGHDIAG
jgi:hypothetical protein